MSYLHYVHVGTRTVSSVPRHRYVRTGTCTSTSTLVHYRTAFCFLEKERFGWYCTVALLLVSPVGDVSTHALRLARLDPRLSPLAKSPHQEIYCATKDLYAVLPTFMYDMTTVGL